jgi:transposase
MAAAALVARTKALADIERSFRVMKSVLELAPVHHRLPDRIRAHTFVCFLALVIQRVMQFRLRKAASELSPETLLYRLKAIQRRQVKLATGQVLVGITTMAAEQRSLFELIGVEPPTRKTAEVGV